MKYIFSILLLVALVGCTTVHMKKCTSKVTDPTIYHCPDQVQGEYRDCDIPKDIYNCVEPN